MGKPEYLELTLHGKAYLYSGSIASGLLYITISCSGHMMKALLDSSASYNSAASPQLKQFASNSIVPAYMC